MKKVIGWPRQRRQPAMAEGARWAGPDRLVQIRAGRRRPAERALAHPAKSRRRQRQLQWNCIF